VAVDVGVEAAKAACGATRVVWAVVVMLIKGRAAVEVGIVVIEACGMDGVRAVAIASRAGEVGGGGVEEAGLGIGWLSLERWSVGGRLRDGAKGKGLGDFF